ncbi:hypothetical protein CC85DRAFT_80004 [Cutaneotrichosporon oleaginosum]|uniref:Uncharacterized protein n=1 Tax=Cutaneotrichosporon oleaginosum TaxID=879819 RepID=A0A0J0XNE9_9TREE|nr:uncharacterized protein CC85DRAFT_80004 [Cutaneotrichosporon oleaginosum]KLT42602.1 hypothetical protein CC85DRAFT_80004 [Cutaneotrichosporon oleaginosum]TXT05281.1 hypothetical protein COLE_06601 [Cutaneotrichosporon oleaginosum]
MARGRLRRVIGICVRASRSATPTTTPVGSLARRSSPHTTAVQAPPTGSTWSHFQLPSSLRATPHIRLPLPVFTAPTNVSKFPLAASPTPTKSHLRLRQPSAPRLPAPTTLASSVCSPNITSSTATGVFTHTRSASVALAAVESAPDLPPASSLIRTPTTSPLGVTFFPPFTPKRPILRRFVAGILKISGKAPRENVSNSMGTLSTTVAPGGSKSWWSRTQSWLEGVSSLEASPTQTLSASEATEDDWHSTSSENGSEEWWGPGPPETPCPVRHGRPLLHAPHQRHARSHSTPELQKLIRRPPPRTPFRRFSPTITPPVCNLVRDMSLLSPVHFRHGYVVVPGTPPSPSPAPPRRRRQYPPIQAPSPSIIKRFWK